MIGIILVIIVFLAVNEEKSSVKFAPDEHGWERDYWICPLYDESCSNYPHIKTAALMYGNQFSDTSSGENQREEIEQEMGIDNLYEWVANHYDFVSPWGGGEREDFLQYNPDMRSLMYNVLGGGGYIVASSDNLVNRRLFSWFDYAAENNVEDLEEFYVHIAEDITFHCSFASSCGPSYEAIFETVYYEKDGIPTDYVHKAFGYYSFGDEVGRRYYDIPFGEANSALYIGDMTPFAELHINLVQSASVDFSPFVEYWNGNSWSELSILNDGTGNFQHSGVIKINPPADWEPHDPIYNPRDARRIYEIRIRNENAPTQNPIAQTYQLASAGALQNVPASAGDEDPGISAFHSEIFIPRAYDYWDYQPENEDLDRGTIIEMNITFLGWHYDNDQNGNGYVDDAEFASRPHPESTARFIHQSRSAGYLYQYMSYGLNLNSDHVKTWLEEATLEDYDSDKYDGIVFDSLGRNVRSRSWGRNTTFIEYSGGLYDPQFEADVTQLMINFQEALPEEIITGNNNFNLYYINILDGSEGESFFGIRSKYVNYYEAPDASALTVKLDRVINASKKDKIMLVHSQAFTNDPEITIERDNMFALAAYYLVDYDSTYFMYVNNHAYGAPWEYWFDAVGYDVGAPIGDYYEFVNGSDPSNPGDPYFVFARNRSKGISLVKFLPRPNSSLGDDSITNHTLPGTYIRLMSNGSLGDEILTSVELLNGEGVVLVDTCFDGVKNLDETGVDCGGGCGSCSGTNNPGGGSGSSSSSSNNEDESDSSYQNVESNIEILGNIFHSARYFIESNTPGVIIILAIVAMIIGTVDYIYLRRKKSNNFLK